jgi:hypothetical protein
MTPPSASDAARWSDSQRPTASLRPHFRPGITLARRSDNGARPRTPGLMSLPRRRIGANSGPTLPPAPTDKPLAPTVDQYLGSGHEPKTCERCPCGLVCEFFDGVRSSVSLSSWCGIRWAAANLTSANCRRTVVQRGHVAPARALASRRRDQEAVACRPSVCRRRVDVRGVATRGHRCYPNNWRGSCPIAVGASTE